MTPDTPPIPAPPPGWAIVPADDARLDCLPARPLLFGNAMWFPSTFESGAKVPLLCRPGPSEQAAFALPIEPQPWSLPAPPAGQAWHRQDGWTAEMLPEGYRPLLLGEPWIRGDEILRNGILPWAIAGAELHDSLNAITKPETAHCRTRRPLPASPAEQPTWQAILAEAKAKEATAGANNPLFSGDFMPPLVFENPETGKKEILWGTETPSKKYTFTVPLHGTDPKGEAGKAKAQLALLPPEALRQAAWAHALGAAKYGVANWRENKVCATTYISAMMRHIGQYLDGENADAESGLSHLAHVIASANILIDAKHCGTLVDDRPKRPA